MLEDGEQNTTTGVYEDVPGVYMVLVKEGNVMRAYPVTSWFKFGATKPAEADPTQVRPVLPVGTDESVRSE